GGAQVGEQRPLAEGDEPVGEALRDPEVALVLRAQQYRGPAPEMRRAAADVDGYVPDLAFEHRDVLALRVGPLVMQPAQHAAGGRRHVALHEARREAVRAQLVEVERLEKEAAIVAEHPRLDDDATGQAGLDQLHGT